MFESNNTSPNLNKHIEQYFMGHRILPHPLLIHRRQPKYGSTLPPERFTAAPMTVLSTVPECSASYLEGFKVTYTTIKAKTMVLIELNYPNYGRLSE